MSDMPRCFIFGALPSRDLREKPCKGDLLIAADKGYERVLELGLTPDLVVGDFDSLGEVPQVDNLIRLNVRKDDTDVGHAVELGFERGYSDFVVYGAVGGLLDHTLANVAIAHDIAVRGGRAMFIGGGYCFTVVHNAELALPIKDGGRVSVFALGGTAHGVTIRGLSYEAEDIDVPCTSHIGVSNEFIGEEARISVVDGDLLIICQI